MDDLFWEVHQQRAMGRASAEAAEASRRAAGAADRVVQLEADVDRLLLITRTLWETLRTMQGVDEGQLVEKLREIDLRDGRLDGRLARPGPQHCTQCRRTLNRRHVQCIYCGSENLRDDPFDAVR